MRATICLFALSVAGSLTACNDYKFRSSNDVYKDTGGLEGEDRPGNGDAGGDDTGGFDVSDDSGWSYPGDDGGGDGGSPGGPGGGDEPPAEGFGDVEGRICDPAGTDWVVGALVYISVDVDGDGGEDYRVETTTDADGYFILEDVPPGTWTVHVEKGSFSTSFIVEVVEGERVTLPEAECLDSGSVDVAVITGEYDDIGAMLTTLTVPYDSYDGTTSTDYLGLLLSPADMAGYDIIFINCGEHMTDWAPALWSDVGTNLADYVYNGGSIYASDWAYPFVEAAWAGAVDWYEDPAYGDDTTIGAAFMGDVGTIDGTILDAEMQSILGTTSAELHYDLNNWSVPVAVGGAAYPLVTGTAPIVGGGSVSGSPLALEMDWGDGRVIFTSFHNERQATVDMELLLMEIILSL